MLALRLEADLPLRKPCELDGGVGHRLLARKVDRGFPVLVSEVAVYFEILTNAFNDLKVEVVERGAARDKVFGRPLSTHTRL